MSPVFPPLPMDPDFPLWAYDHSVAQALHHDPGEAARRWVKSAGRSIHDAADKAAAVGALLGQRENIYSAAGVADLPTTHDALPAWFHGHLPAWRELHATIPGVLLSLWEPVPPSPSAALSTLDEGQLWWARGAALGWLLRGAAASPATWTARGFRTPLHARFAADLPPSAITPDPALLSRREHALLRAASALNDGDAHPLAPVRVWAIARWLHGSLALCGATGVVEANLAPAPPSRDLLDPSRFGPGDEPSLLSLREVALVGGLGVVSTSRRLPPELAGLLEPLLVPIAQRRMEAAEIEVERDRAAGAPNALAWPTSRPIAPPVGARKLLSELGIGWLARAESGVLEEALDRLVAAPTNCAWMMLALWREGPKLSDEARRLAAACWRLMPVASGEAVACLMAAGILESLDADDDEDTLLELVTRAGEKWGPALLDALCVAAVRAGRDRLFRRAIDRLCATVESEAASPSARQNAMLTLLRRWEEAPRHLKLALEAVVRAAAQQQVVRSREELWRDIRRLGLDNAPLEPARLAR